MPATATRSIALLGSPLAGRKVRVTTAPPLVVVRKNGSVLGTSTPAQQEVDGGEDGKKERKKKQSFKVGVAIQARVKLDQNGAPISVVATPLLTSPPALTDSKTTLPLPPLLPSSEAAEQARGERETEADSTMKPPRKKSSDIVLLDGRSKQEEAWDSTALALPMPLQVANYFALHKSRPSQPTSSNGLIPTQILPDRLRRLREGPPPSPPISRTTLDDRISWIQEEPPPQQQRSRPKSGNVVSQHGVHEDFYRSNRPKSRKAQPMPEEHEPEDDEELRHIRPKHGSIVCPRLRQRPRPRSESTQVASEEEEGKTKRREAHRKMESDMPRKGMARRRTSGDHYLEDEGKARRRRASPASSSSSGRQGQGQALGSDSDEGGGAILTRPRRTRRGSSCLAPPLANQVQEVMHKLYGQEKRPPHARRRSSCIQPLDSKVGDIMSRLY